MNVDKIISGMNLSTNKINVGNIDGRDIILKSTEESVIDGLNEYIKYGEDHAWLYNGPKRIKNMTDEYIKEQLSFISRHNDTPYFITWRNIFIYELKKRRRDKLNKICGR